MHYNEKHQNTQKPKLMIMFIGKVFTFKKGGLFLTALPFGLSITEMLQNLFKDVSPRELHLPLFSSAIVLMLFMLFYIMDFFTGLAAARKEAKGEPFIQSEKLWRSFWKLYGYVTLLVFLNGFCITFAVMANNFFYHFFLYAIMVVGFMFSMFEFHSIGENWERMYGSKHKMFQFFDKVTKTVETKIIDKINNAL